MHSRPTILHRILASHLLQWRRRKLRHPLHPLSHRGHTAWQRNGVAWQLPGQILTHVPGFGIWQHPRNNNNAPPSQPSQPAPSNGPQQPAASSSHAASSTAPQVDMLQVPVRGRDVRHSTSATSRAQAATDWGSMACGQGRQ